MVHRNNASLPAALQDPEPYRPREPSTEENHNSIDRGPLDTLDVFALIVNKMVGTGIYTAPASVFLMTGNKALTLGLFGVGFVYSIVSMVIYLDFAKVLPFNGGELIYLSEITSYVSADNVRSVTRPYSLPNTQPNTPSTESDSSLNCRRTAETTVVAHDEGTRHVRWWRKVFGDGLCAFINYSIAVILFFNSGTNSMQFGRMVLLCIQSDRTGVNNVPADINRDLMRFIGIVVLSVICLLQYFGPSFGRRLNKTLVIIKLGSLLGLLISEIVATTRDIDIDRSADWTVWHDSAEPNKIVFAKAMLSVLFSFQGWENATFVSSPCPSILIVFRVDSQLFQVAGEIPRGKHYILRRGFIAAVWTVGCFYLLIVALFLHSITWDDLTKGKTNVNYPPMLTGNGAESRRAWAVMAAISSFGSLNAIIYTYSRVKQAIGQAQVLPWSRFLKQDDHLQRTFEGPSNTEFHHKAPQGGLIIHWLMSVVVISASAGIHSTVESAGLPGYIHAYLHCFVLMVLGMGFFNLKSRERALWSAASDNRRKERGTLSSTVLSLTVVLYILTNLTILVVNPIPPYTASDGSEYAFGGYGFPVILVAILVVSTAYYFLFFGAARILYQNYESPDEHSDTEDMQPSVPDGPQQVNSALRQETRWNLMRWADVQCEIRKNYVYGTSLERVYRFGRRWKIVYYVPGDDGYNGSHTTLPSQGGVTFATFLYWLFGGTRLNNAWNPGSISRRDHDPQSTQSSQDR
ncbi:High-affinity methionine permease [Fusarium albosuccineum]|uniref:High-affinity methionine permease n=1 Tax=Fusarium albosuccineum TaxID=1237068 RepID=A0A8H4L0E5_9HYPO|nr:High-affinity methionine permease [Fusarium albosuccineum]